MSKLLREYVKSLLSEAIKHPPIRRTDFMLGIGKRAGILAAFLSKKLHDLNSFQDKETLDDYINSGTNRNVSLREINEEIERFVTELKEIVGRVDGHVKLANTSRGVEVAKWVRYTHDFLNHFEEDNARRFTRMASDYEHAREELINYAKYYTADGITSDTVAPHLDAIFASIKEFFERIQYDKDKIDTLAKRITKASYAQRDSDMRPEHDDVELLYHTTANATQLEANGFHPDGPLGVEGLGGSQGDNSGKAATSFTSNLYIAKEILRCLKEAIMIAKGELHMRDVLRMSDEAGIYEEMIKKYRLEMADKDETPAVVFDFYRYYLAHAESGSKRYNPLFFGMPETLVAGLVKKNVEDCGILVCKVDMTNPDVSYEMGMDEFRAPAKAILSIEKVLK